MREFGRFYLDREKDMIVDLYQEKGKMRYVLSTPNHGTGNLIRNFAKLCELPLSTNEKGLLEIRGNVPCYVTSDNSEVYIFRLKDTKVANIYPDGRIEMKAAVPSIAKTLMSQTKDYRLDVSKTIFKTYILKEYKFRTDLHTHMNGNLSPDILIALGICHQIRYPLYYIKKLDLHLTASQRKLLEKQRKQVEKQIVDDGTLSEKHFIRKIDDNTFINFADLILNNIRNAAENIQKIRISLAVLKDGQAVFTNLEKTYLYRYVFTKAKPSRDPIPFRNVNLIPDEDIRHALQQMLQDRVDPVFAKNSLFQDKLLWIARQAKEQGIEYMEISDTTLVKKFESVHMLQEVHAIMPVIQERTGVLIRFLAAIRRIPLNIVKKDATPDNYLRTNLQVLKATCRDPYVAGCDFVGEEINDIIELKPVIAEIVKLAAQDPDFVIRIHAGENDSLKDNMAHSIACVKDSLQPGQKFPKMRIGHGLYTYGLNTRKGRQLLKDVRDHHVVLEFQISSNVRLNNLNALDVHPLRQYLNAGISCVQGTDGGALYGTDSIDEQLSLEKLLNLTTEDVGKMKEAETQILAESRKAFKNKQKKWIRFLNGREIEDALLTIMDKDEICSNLGTQSNRLYSETELSDKIEELPWDKTPVVLMGGSFNTDKRHTRTCEEGRKQLDGLLKTLNPEEYFFVIGHTVSGYEKYLLEHRGNFKIFAFIPSMITEKEVGEYRRLPLTYRVSTESIGMGLYKSFNYEIFKRRPSVVIAFDGNSSGANMIQEAKNGNRKARILVWEKAEILHEKALSLEGYVQFFTEDKPLESWFTDRKCNNLH